MHFTQQGMNDAYRALATRVRVDLDFLALTPIATIVCTFGFKMDSASVIIGAMVLSPLLYSVICVGAEAQKRRSAEAQKRRSAEAQKRRSEIGRSCLTQSGLFR